MAARSLGIKLDQQCFDKPTDQQAPCLVQHTDGLVLDDANAQSLVTQLANGSAGDLMNQLSYSSMAGAGALQPLCRRHCGYGQDPRLAAYRAFPVHSGAGPAHQRYAQSAPECSAFVSRSQVGGGGRAAARGPAQAAAASSIGCERDLLRAKAGPGAAGRGRAGGVLYAIGLTILSCTSK